MLAQTAIEMVLTDAANVVWGKIISDIDITEYLIGIAECYSENQLWVTTEFGK